MINQFGQIYRVLNFLGKATSGQIMLHLYILIAILKWETTHFSFLIKKINFKIPF